MLFSLQKCGYAGRIKKFFEASLSMTARCPLRRGKGFFVYTFLPAKSPSAPCISGIHHDKTLLKKFFISALCTAWLKAKKKHTRRPFIRYKKTEKL
jgi:hypothetical protein